MSNEVSTIVPTAGSNNFKTIFAVQYKSYDGIWYDWGISCSLKYIRDIFEYLETFHSKENHRIVRRIEEVVE